MLNDRKRIDASLLEPHMGNDSQVRFASKRMELQLVSFIKEDY